MKRPSQPSPAPPSHQQRRPSRRALLAGAAAALLVASSCLSPTLPLPPPSPPEVEPLGQGQYALRGTIPEPGTVVALNARTDLVYGQVTEGAYRFLVAAEPGDVMLVWYEIALETSTSVRIRIPEAEAPDAGAPPADAN